MRSAHAVTATCSDVFVDPYAKWVLHVFFSLRKELLKGSPLAQKDLAKAREILNVSPAPLPACRCGRHNIIAYLCRELELEISSENVAVFHRKNDTDFILNLYSHRFFKEELARTTRRYLINRIPRRHDFCEPIQEDVDIHRTRLLLDTSFQADGEWSFLCPFFDRLPNNPLTSAILPALLQGYIYTNSRRHAAGMCQDDSCLHCGCKENRTPGQFSTSPRFLGTQGPCLNQPLPRKFVSRTSHVVPLHPHPLNPSRLNMLSQMGRVSMTNGPLYEPRLRQWCFLGKAAMQKSPPEQIILLLGLRATLCCWQYCYLGVTCVLFLIVVM